MNPNAKNKSFAAGKAGTTLIAAALVMCVPFIKWQEGRSLVPYADIVGVMTYCDGETENVRLDHVATDAECDALTAKRLQVFAESVYGMLEQPARDSLTADRLMAFTSFSYNVGINAFAASTMLRLANSGDVVGSCGQFLRWSKVSTQRGGTDDKRDGVSDGKKDCHIAENKCMGISKRRHLEKAACLKGVQ